MALLAAPIHAYRHLLSPLTPPSCRFVPSCSAYALEALQVHGPAKGLALAVRRLARCHPIGWLGGGQGFDPVPSFETSPNSQDSPLSEIPPLPEIKVP